MKVSSKMRTAFGGKSVLLTGAGSGIGRALALRLVECGATVHAADRNGEALEKLSKETGGPGKIEPRVLDVSDNTDFGRWVEECSSGGVPIDFLINNAGVTLLGEAHKVSFDRWKWLLDINLMGVIYGTNHVYPLMVKQGSGHIVSTGSVAGVTGYATACAYTSAKNAVIGMSESLAPEAEVHGVKVTVVCPGYVSSNLFNQDRVVGANVDEVLKDLPAPMMTPDDAALGYLKGIISGKRRVVFPANAKLLCFIAAWVPTLLRPIQNRLMRKFEH